MMYLVSAVFIALVYSVSGQSREDCLSNKDCPSDRLCSEFKCVNPCLLNLCGDNSDCKVSNHIPVCGCRGGFSGPLNGGTFTDDVMLDILMNKILFAAGGKKKYQLFLERLTWLEALVHCSSQGMRLATIESQGEQDKIANLIKQSDQGAYKTESTHRKKWWIGGSDLHRRGKFLWFSSGKPIKYSNFPNGQPDNLIYANGERERCLELPEEWNYKWNDFMCDHSQYFICEYFE